MSKDYAKNNRRATRSHSASIPGWVWLLTGLVTGVFVMFLVFLAGLTPSPAPDQPVATDKTNAPAETKAEKPIFEFYDTLMNNEVIPPPSQQASEKLPNTGGTAVYMLQAASFKKLSEADSLKARLILEGLDASIAQFDNRGEIYHRVMVGPFTDVEKMAKAKKVLAGHNISPMVLQKKPGT